MPIDDDLKRAQRMRLPWWGVLCVMAGVAPFVILLGNAGRLQLALPIIAAVSALGFAIAIKWRLRRHPWFWATIAVFAVIQAFAVVYIPWTTEWVPAIVTTGIAVVDLYVMLWIVSFVENVVTRRRRSG